MFIQSIQESQIFKAGEQGTLTVFPMAESLMTGVIAIFHNSPRYQIQYSDGTAEETIYESDSFDWQENLFTFVSTLQENARGK